MGSVPAGRFTISDATGLLSRLADYERITGYRYDDKNFNLDRTRRLLDALGRPQEKVIGVLVAGTKGKGSACAMLASILAASGKRTGLFTSPHLLEYRERIRIGLDPVTEDRFAAAVSRVAGPVQEMMSSGPPTTFEALTAAAFGLFAEEEAEVVVIEVGMGGRLDATNVFFPLVACITPVSLDHVDQLGSTLKEVAGEKAGIVKSESPVICGPQSPEALEVIERACRKMSAPLNLVGRELAAVKIEMDAGRTRFTARTPQGELEGLEMSLIGRHQVDNALVALGAALALPERLKPASDAVRKGLARTVWPGRLQRLASDDRVILDGAHNPAAALALAEAVRDLFSGRKLVLVLGHLKGKSPDEFARIVCPLAEKVVVAQLRHPRALPADGLARIVSPHAASVLTAGSTAEALEKARGAAGQDGMILVTGSLAVVGEALAASGAKVC